jgi:hypothetical protein
MIPISPAIQLHIYNVTLNTENPAQLSVILAFRHIYTSLIPYLEFMLDGEAGEVVWK